MPRPSLKKRLGQHHLVDGRLCRPLIDFLEPAGSRVAEIGPGGGALTRELVAAGARVWALELDLEWAFALPALLAADAPAGAAVSLAVADAADFAWGRLPSPTLVTGNLPYNVATAILRRLLRHPAAIPRAAFMVQWEVGERLVARPGDPAYGALSVLTAARASVMLLGRVKAGSFRPPPKVDGALVGLTLGAPPLPADAMPSFEATVHLAFAQRRKQLKNSLAAGWGKRIAGAALAAAGIPASARAEELPLPAFLALHRAKVTISGD